jgi:hypothetical protein
VSDRTEVPQALQRRVVDPRTEHPQLTRVLADGLPGPKPSVGAAPGIFGNMKTAVDRVASARCAASSFRRANFLPPPTSTLPPTDPKCEPLLVFYIE